jgi:proteasome activator subunit 4
MFIVTTVQHIMIGDLSGLPDCSVEEEMDIDRQTQALDGSRETYVLSKNDERALVRDSTAGFAGEYLDSYHD